MENRLKKALHERGVPEGVDRPHERELLLAVGVGDVDRVGFDEEEDEQQDVEDDEVDFPLDLLKVVVDLDDLRDVVDHLEDLFGLPDAVDLGERRVRSDERGRLATAGKL